MEASMVSVWIIAFCCGLAGAVIGGLLARGRRVVCWHLQERPKRARKAKGVTGIEPGEDGP